MYIAPLGLFPTYPIMCAMTLQLKFYPIIYRCCSGSILHIFTEDNTNVLSPSTILMIYNFMQLPTEQV